MNRSLALLLIGLAGCADPRTAVGTALYVRVAFDPTLELTQLRAAVESEQGEVGAVQVPETPAGALGAPQTFRFLLPDALDGNEVTIDVQGLASGVVAASGRGRATVIRGYEVEVSIALSASGPGADAGRDAGFDAGPEDALDAGSDGGSEDGPDAGSCIECDPARSDGCSPENGCLCGAGPSCGDGQRCAEGLCVCDATSCPGGCCDGNVCLGPSPSSCGTEGESCVACAQIADTCSPEGTCACGTGPACDIGQRCVGGACICDAASCVEGCCDGTTCQSGDLDSACGASGSACETCPSDETCMGGVCSGCNAESCPAGCCSGSTCILPSPGACGSGGEACLACGAEADNCSPFGACQCGIGPVCGSGQRCVSGACVCDPTSCPSGCCAGNTCRRGDVMEACGRGGRACADCTVLGSDNCGPVGCRCGNGPACKGVCLLGICAL